MDGLWSLVLDFNNKRSGATIVITDGRILGGDSGMTYLRAKPLPAHIATH